jgi:putative endonuclease
MSLWRRITDWWRGRRQPRHLEIGQRGEALARRHLEKQGLKFLLANYQARRGEIDLVMRCEDCLVFVEVKTRAAGGWTRPAAAVNRRKRQILSRTALHYVRSLRNPYVKIRFDIVEVLLNKDNTVEIRHLPNTFNLSPPYQFG